MDEAETTTTRGTRDRALQALRTVIRNDGAAYSYSLVATASFGVLQQLDGGVSVGRAFAFVLSAASAFVVVEAVGSRGFRDPGRPDRGDVVVLGNAFGIVAVAAGLGSTSTVAWLLDGWWAWTVGPFAGSLVYVLFAATNMAIARRAEERMTPPRA